MKRLLFDKTYPTAGEVNSYLESYTPIDKLEDPEDIAILADVIVNRTQSLARLLTHSEFLYLLWRFRLSVPNFPHNLTALSDTQVESYTQIVTGLFGSDQSFCNSGIADIDESRLKRVAKKIIGIQYNFLIVMLAEKPEEARINEFLNLIYRSVENPFFKRIGKLD